MLFNWEEVYFRRVTKGWRCNVETVWLLYTLFQCLRKKSLRDYSLFRSTFMRLLTNTPIHSLTLLKDINKVLIKIKIIVFPEFYTSMKSVFNSERKCINININKDNENSIMQSNNPNTPVNYEHLISYSNNFIEDELYLKQLLDELEFLNLYSPQSARPSTMSLSLKNNNHDPRSRNLASQDLSKYPTLFKLRELVNQHSDVGKELDCCNVVCLSNNKQSVRLHADNESISLTPLQLYRWE